MLVYGDPQFQDTLSAAKARLMSEAEACSPGELDDVRKLLIQAGQLEQAVADARCAPRVISASGAVTDLAAKALYDSWSGGAANQTGAWLSALKAGLRKLSTADDLVLTVKIPEGFEFYALYPEQYCAAAGMWAKARGPKVREVLVVGIRSIGTTLSAVVKAAVEASGWRARRLTVRPGGSPFQRDLAVKELGAVRAPFAIVVDEGPGLSGSSIVAVVTALRRAGITDISIFPGHNGEPGNAGSGAVRKVWEETPRYVVALDEIRWGGLGLKESLRKRTVDRGSGSLWSVDSQSLKLRRTGRGERAALTTRNAEAVDFSGGLWRNHLYESEEQWPAVAALFERMKLRQPCADGRAVLWKFAGLGSAYGPTHDHFPAQPNPKWLGFEALEWQSGRPLRIQDCAAPSLVQQAADYLVSSAGPGLSPEEQASSAGRLRDLVYWNTREALGEEFAGRARGFMHEVSVPTAEGVYSYTDGRMAPHEWLHRHHTLPRERVGGMPMTASRPDKQLVKVDTHGNVFDHTCVGPQSLLWDVAGLCVEWALDGNLRRLVFGRLQAARPEIRLEALALYEAAYAAFRMGLCHLAHSQTQDLAEQVRLRRACDGYKRKLIGFLQGGATRRFRV